MRIFLLVALLLPLSACKEKAGNTHEVGAPGAGASENSLEPAAAVRKTPKLVRAEPLSTEARMALRAKMLDHGDDMENLLWSALMLDYESTAAVADKMAKAPTLSRAGPGQEDTVNALLPPEFFELQDQLLSSIRGLRAAAEEKQDGGMADEYAKVASTCIQCHSLYLHFPTQAEE